MNRRSLLAASTTSLFFGLSGCLDESTDGENTEPSECKEKEEWEDATDIESGDPAPESIAGLRDCEKASRPEPTGGVCSIHEVETSHGEVTYESVGIEPYPNPPSTVDEESAIAFVENYERAFIQNELVLRYGDRLVGGGANIKEHESEIIERYDEITAVSVQRAVSYSTVSRGGLDATGAQVSYVAYAVDETGIVREVPDYYTLDESGEKVLEKKPDPLEDGDLIECRVP